MEVGERETGCGHSIGKQRKQGLRVCQGYKTNGRLQHVSRFQHQLHHFERLFGQNKTNKIKTLKIPITCTRFMGRSLMVIILLLFGPTRPLLLGCEIRD